MPKTTASKTVVSIAAAAAVIVLVFLVKSDLIFNFRLLLSDGFDHSDEIAMPAKLRPQCPNCNVIFVMMDTFRADRLGVNSSSQSLTPNLDTLARQGVNFKNAFSNAFYTTPSHMTIFTSLFPQVHQVLSHELKLRRVAGRDWPSRPLDQRYKTLAQIFSANNYTTIWSGPLSFNQLGRDLGFMRGFEILLPSVFHRALFRGHQEHGVDMNRWREVLARAGGSRRPFFLFLHSYITHMPYVNEEIPQNSQVPYSRMDLLRGLREEIVASPRRTLSYEESRTINRSPDRFQPCLIFPGVSCVSHLSIDQFGHRVGQFQLGRMYDLMPNRDKVKEIEWINKAYDAGVRDLDTQIGKIWPSLSESGLLKNTIVVFLSDHGEELFERGDGSHSSFYDSVIRVPLFLLGPGIPAEREFTQPVSLVDIMPTILEIVGIPSPAQTQGTSVFHKDPRTYEFGYTLGLEYVRGQKWKLLKNEKGDSELYYLPLDPQEHRNLYRSRNFSARAAKTRLTKALNDWKLGTAL